MSFLSQRRDFDKTTNVGSPPREMGCGAGVKRSEHLYGALIITKCLYQFTGWKMCHGCRNGRGPFKSCGELAGFADETCANCVWRHREKDCGLKNYVQDTGKNKS